ncbi:MAG: MFS transporter [Pseudomonadota bacterium]
MGKRDHSKAAGSNPARETVYASGNFGKNILWHSADVALLFVFTELLGIDPRIAGTLILASLVFDGILDPVVGLLAERLRTRWGRYGPLLLVGAPLSAVTFTWLFALPYLQISNLWVVAASLVAFRAAYTLIDIPHNAMLSGITQCSESRSHIAGLRFLFSSIAALVLSLSISRMVEDQQALSPFSLLVFGASAAASSLLVLLLVWQVFRPFDQPLERGREMPSVRTIWRAIVRNRQFVLVITISLVGSLTLPLFAKSVLYFTRYVLGDVGVTSYCLTAMVFGQLCALPWWMHVAKSRENAVALRWAHVTLLASSLLFLAFGANSAAAAIALSFFVGAAASGVYSLVWAMIADCVDIGERISGTRIEPMLFALATFVQKSAIGLGAWLFGMGLASSGYTPGTAPTNLLDLTIRFFGLGMPAIGAVVCILLLKRYSITHDEHTKTVRLLRT